MKLSNMPISLDGPEGPITVARNQHGIPEISGESLPAVAYGLGWCHAHDRQLQVIVTRLVAQGRTAEHLAGTPELIAVDRYMRRLNLMPDADREAAKLKPEARKICIAYMQGFNRRLKEAGPVWELRLLGHTPWPLEMKDLLIIPKIMGFIGLADAQGGIERLIVQMIQKGIDDGRMRELFPNLTDRIDRNLLAQVRLSPPPVPSSIKWVAALPRFIASNNWAVSGKLTASGKPILCSDPHLEVNRIPCFWYEAVLRTKDNTYIGATLPGVPGILLGRSSHIAWGPTFAFMDMIDFRIEECRGGAFRRGNKWVPFTEREETIQVKKGDTVTEIFYENEHGVLEGNPYEPGYYLVMSWSAARGCGAGDFNAMLGLTRAKTAREAISLLRMMEAGSWNFLVADKEGNIGYQMTGRCFNRPAGTSGLLALPGWDKKYDPRGFVPADKLPTSINPSEGFLHTANNDLNHLGKARVINLCMAPYRADRIRQIITSKTDLSVSDMKEMHYDLLSLQAVRLMAVIRPLLPDTQAGNTLRDWDCRYTAESVGATLFESVYRSLLLVVFGDGGMGRDTVRYLLEETSLLNDYFGNFDDILMKKKSRWFGGSDRETLFRRAIAEGLAAEASPYGEGRQVIFTHLLLGRKLPLAAGFDRGPFVIPGSRATILQGQIFRTGGRDTTFSPSFRLIADMSSDELHTNMPGGPSDRRFSRWYHSDMDNWRTGTYKVLR